MHSCKVERTRTRVFKLSVTLSAFYLFCLKGHGGRGERGIGWMNSSHLIVGTPDRGRSHLRFHCVLCSIEIVHAAFVLFRSFALHGRLHFHSEAMPCSPLISIIECSLSEIRRGFASILNQGSDALLAVLTFAYSGCINLAQRTVYCLDNRQ